MPPIKGNAVTGGPEAGASADARREQEWLLPSGRPLAEYAFECGWLAQGLLPLLAVHWREAELSGKAGEASASDRLVQLEQEGPSCVVREAEEMPAPSRGRGRR